MDFAIIFIFYKPMEHLNILAYNHFFTPLTLHPITLDPLTCNLQPNTVLNVKCQSYLIRVENSRDKNGS